MFAVRLPSWSNTQACLLVGRCFTRVLRTAFISCPTTPRMTSEKKHKALKHGSAKKTKKTNTSRPGSEQMLTQGSAAGSFQEQH